MFTLTLGIHWVRQQMGNCLRRHRHATYSTVRDDTIHQPDHLNRSRPTDEVDRNQSMHKSTSDLTDIGVDVVDGRGLTAEIHPATRNTTDSLPPIHNIEEYLFLSNKSTMNFLKNSQTIFIMRGVPGSGKSVLVEHIKRAYPGAVVCSADHYFYNRDGHYRFDKSKLSEAHEASQENANRHCENGCHVVIIDNTHIQRREMAPYLRLAQNVHRYHVFVVEPNTPWKLDPSELVKRNRHNVGIEIIERKVESFKNHNVLPAYYGWFLRKEDSEIVVELAKKYLRDASDGIRENAQKTHLKDMLRQFESNSTYVKPSARLHCTSKFTGGSAKDPYHTQIDVKKSMGRVFDLEVESFVYTPLAIGARVRLNAEELNLFSKGEELILQSQYDIHEMHTELSDSRSGYRKENEHNRQQQVTVDRSEFKLGCSAHITISFVNGSQAKVTGDEVLQICEEEHKGNVKRHGTSEGILCCYEGGSRYQFIPRNTVTFTTIFHGFYPART